MPPGILLIPQQPVSDGSWQSCLKVQFPVKPNVIRRDLGSAASICRRLAPKPVGCHPQVSALARKNPCASRQDAGVGCGVFVLLYQYNVFFGRLPP